MTEPKDLTPTVLRYEEPMRRFRFLINDGRVIDVEARRDDSNLRGWLLDQLKIARPKTGRWDVSLVGVTELVDAPLTLLDETVG